MDGMSNNDYWKEYEKVTGEKRPPWIDGVGNVNYQFGKKTPPPVKIPAKVLAQQIPQVQSQGFNYQMMPQVQAQAWRPGLRGWSPGW